MFISFEGIDGSGKSTQIQLLKEKLEVNNHKVVTLREPGGSQLSENIREILLNKDYNINSETELLLFESARAYLTQNVIIPAIDKGEIVLIDRFFDSTIAYQGYGRGIDLDFINSCNMFATQNIIPDITFYLKINMNTSNLRRITLQKDRIENSGLEFYNNVINGFEEIAIKNKDRVITIDGNKDVNLVHNDIVEIINQKYNIF